MIETNRETGEFVLSCDEVACDSSERFNTNGNFKGMVHKAIKKGWSIRLVDGAWMHRCSVCVADKGKLQSPKFDD